MLDDRTPLSDDEIDEILDAFASFGGAVSQALPQAPSQVVCNPDVEVEVMDGCQVLRPLMWKS